VDVWVNDEGLLNGMQPHPTLGLRGPLVIARHEGPETTSIRPSDATEGRWLVMSGAIRMYAVRAGLLGHDGNGRLVPVDPPPPLVLDSYREVDVIGWARTHRPAIEHALDVARTALLADVRTLAEKAEREDKSEPERAALKRLSEEFQRYVARIEAAVEALPW
jgi:hypothetical protein